MSDPISAANQPVLAKLEGGKTYAWCRCGRSVTQPFCDGAHKLTDLRPLVFTAEADKEAWFCQCKQTKNPPYCDGTHRTL